MRRLLKELLTRLSSLLLINLSQQSLASPYWAFAFTNMIDDEVKLSGMTISCGGRPDFPDDKIAHVQTMVWSTDQVGLSVILDSGSIYDCGNQLEEEHGRDALVVKYEIGMSRAIMEVSAAEMRGIERSYMQRLYM